MKQALWLASILLGVAPRATLGAEDPKPLLTGLRNPASVAAGADGRAYLTVSGAPDKDGSGAVLVVDKGKAVPFAAGLDDPRGLAAHAQWLFVADKQRLWR